MSQPTERGLGLGQGDSGQEQGQGPLPTPHRVLRLAPSGRLASGGVIP